MFPREFLTTNLRRHVDTLAGLIGSRHMQRPSSMDAAVAYIERELSPCGTVVRERFPVHDAEAVNLVLEYAGAEKSNEIVLLGAHYDTVNTTPGADDNASAVAVLLECARLLKDGPRARTVRFVAFANEEPPHFYTDTMGSQFHARMCRMRGETLVGMLCLEMVGFFSDAPNSQQYPQMIPRPFRALLPSKGNFLGIVSNMKSAGLLARTRSGFRKESKLPLIALPLPESISEIRLSDHAQFWDQNYPALMFTDTSFFRNPHYHRESDTPDTLDYARMTEVALGVAGAVKYLAG